MMRLQIKQYNRDLIPFFLVGLAGIMAVVLFLDPFNQPILFDRAYLLYMSQEISRGAPVYQTTTFGYTPLSTWLVGYAMKMGSLMGLSTIESARVTGIICYGIICGFMWSLLKQYFNKSTIIILGAVLFIGLDALRLLASVNAEPKILVLLFSIIGLWQLNKHNYFGSALFFTFASMSWQLSVINLFGVLISMWMSGELKIKTFINLSLGVLIGCLPVVVYLTFTDSWLEFFDQAVLRKLYVEGDTINDSPFKWLLTSIWPWFLSEAIYFLWAFISFLAILINKWKIVDNHRLPFRNLLIYTLIWSLMNTLEFQGGLDFIPLTIPLIIYLTYGINQVLAAIKRKPFRLMLMSCLIAYAFYDSVFNRTNFTFDQQQSMMKQIHQKYGNVAVLGFEELFVIMEKPIEGKLMRNMKYEDYFIQNDPELCKSSVTRKPYLIAKRLSDKTPIENRQNSSSTMKKLKNLVAPKESFLGQPGQCVDQFMNKTPIDSVTFQIFQKDLRHRDRLIEFKYDILEIH